MIKQIHQQSSANTQPTRQKQQALLITNYRQAIALLHQPSTRQQGKQKLLSILANPDCQQQHLRQLRLSTLLSLAELYRLEGNKMQALIYWYQSTNIQDGFNVWVKMAQTLQSLRQEYLKYNKEQKSNSNIGQFELEQQIEHAYKKSIELSPPQWRGQLLQTLHKVYIEHNKTFQAQDLHKIIRENLYEMVTAKDTGGLNKETMNQQGNREQMSLKNQKQAQKIQKLDQIRVPLYFLQSNDSICLWDYLFSFSYLLLTVNNAAKKISKKHQDIISRISKFSITDTKIVLDTQKPFLDDKVSFQEQNKQQQYQNCNGNNRDVQYLLEDEMQQKQNQLVQPIPRAPSQPSPLQYAQKLHYLIIDTLKELCRDKQQGSAIQKSKKNQLPTSTSSTANSKAIFQNIYEYFKQALNAKGIDVQMLNALKYVDLHCNPTLQSVLSIHANDQNQSTPHKSFENIIEPIIVGVKSAVQKEQQQSSLEQEGLGPRERRSTTLGNSIVTPTPNRKTQQSKSQQIMLNKLKQSFQQKLLLSKQFEFSNILYLSDIQINQFVGLLMSNKINLLTEQQSQVFSSIFFKNTSKIIFLLIAKLSQLSAFSILDATNWKLSLKTGITLGSLLLKGFDQEFYGGVAGISSSIRQIWESLSRFCINSLDKLIYSKTISNKKYDNEELTSILELLNLSILVHSTPNFVDQNRLTQLCNYYEKFSILLNHDNESLILASDAVSSQLVLKPLHNIWAPLSLNNMFEVVTARKRKCKLKQLSQQQCEKSSLMSSIDNLFKSDMKSSQIVESVKSILSNKNSSLVLCLRSFGRVVENLFQNIEQITGGFGVKYIQNSLKCMEIPSLIQYLHSKLTQEKKGDRGKQETEDPKKRLSFHQAKEQYLFKLDTLFSLVKIYLLQELDQHISSVCLRIVFYLLEDAFKSMVEFQRQFHENQMKTEIQEIQEVNNPSICLHYYNRNQICRLIVLIDALIKAKESVQLRKKFYHRVLIKNIPYIYNLYSYQKLDEPQLQNQVYRILSEAFHNKNFKPKKIQDCNGYFLMISRQFSSEFDQQVVEFEQKMKRVCNQCYLIFKDQFEEHFPICSRFKKAMELFVFLMRKKFKQSQQLIDFFTSKQIICECCQAPYLKNELNKQSFAKQTIFAVAKYLQNKKNSEKGPIQSSNKEVNNEQENSGEKEDKGIKKPQNYIELQDEIQNYYLKYFLLAINTGKAWLHMLRFQVSKVYQYFDALMGIQTAETIIADSPAQTTPNPDSVLQCYKHKFKYAKSIASFIIKNFSTQEYEQVREYAIYRVHLMNTLKIQQRKLNYRLSVLEKNSQLIKINYNKYMQGILAIISHQKQTEQNQIDLTNCYPEVSYLLYVQYRLPFLVYKLENEPDLQASCKFLQFVLKQGILLIQQLAAHLSRSAQQYSQQSGANNNKYKYSRYQVSHLKDSLKVQISVTISDLILNNLQYIKMEAELMQRQIQRCSVPTNANPKKYYRDRLQPQKQQKLIEKLQKLSSIAKVLNSFEFEIQSWKNQELVQQPSCQKRSQKIQFRTKYQFPQYIEPLTLLQKNLLQIVQVLHSYSILNPLKPRRQNYSRSIFLCNLYCSTIFHQLNSRDQCLTYIKQISNGKNEEIINFYHHYQKKPTQENNILAQFYCRDIVYHGVKIKAIQHKLEVYAGKMETLEIGLALIRKLGKLAVCKIQTEKDKAKDKIEENGDGKIKEGQNRQQIKKQGIKLKVNEDLNEEQGEKADKGRQKKKGKKQGKEGKDPKSKPEKGNKIQKRIKWMYFLQLRGIEIFLDTVVNSSNTKNEPVDEKFEKALLQFKNKLKRQNEKEKKKTTDQNQVSKPYGARLASDLQGFIQHYEQKYAKKLRLKAAKKPKEDPTIQANAETKNNLDVGPEIQNMILIKKQHEKQGNEFEQQFVYNIKQEEQADNEILNENENENQDSEEDNNQVDGFEYEFREYEGQAVKREEDGGMMDEGRQYMKSHIRFNYGMQKNQMNENKMQLDQEINEDYEKILQQQNQWDEDSDNP